MGILQTLIRILFPPKDMFRTLAVINGVQVIQFDNLRCEFTGIGRVDADGANGQNGKQAAYMVNDKGSDFLANGGMRMRDGRVIGNQDWFRDIAILGEDDQPRVFEGGVIASKTAYKWPGNESNDPSAYLDSEVIPYGVIPPSVRRSAKGIVLGCKARFTNTQNGKTIEGVIGDIGPSTKIGEYSIATFRALGLPSSPRNGGTEKKIIKCEFWPGTPAQINGETYALIPA